MKKLLVLLMVGLLAAGISACGANGGNDGNSNGGGGGIGGNDGNTGQDRSTAKSSFYVVLITGSDGVGDQGVNDQLWDGIEKAGEELGIRSNYLEPKTEAEYAGKIRMAMEGEADLIICADPAMSEAVAAAAEENVDGKFAILDTIINKNNVACLTYAGEQGAFLAGLAAGMTTETGKVAFVCGEESEGSAALLWGCEAGVRASGSEAEVQRAFVGSGAADGAASEKTKQLIDQGADVVVEAAGDSGAEVIRAAAAAGVLVVGTERNGSSLAPEHVLCTVARRRDLEVYHLIERLTAGDFSGGVVVSSLADGCVELRDETGKLPPEVKAVAEKWGAAIADGSVIVPRDQHELERFESPQL